MIVTVTGSNGFLGRHVTNQLQLRGHTVVEFDLPASDILNSMSVQGSDAVIHLAGVLGTSELYRNISHAINVNVHGTVNVLDACVAAGGVPFIGITMPDCWHNVYQATKLCAWRIANGYHHDAGLPVIHLRVFNAYGEGQAYGPDHPQKIIPTFAAASWSGVPMPIWGDGSQLVDLVYAGDVANRFTRLVELFDADSDDEVDQYLGRTYDVGTGKPVTVLDAARRVGAVTGSTLVEFLPMREGESPTPTADPTALFARDFGPFAPVSSWHQFEETVKWYVDRAVDVR